ncbi:ankyrin repeat domain-containing protein 26-like [Falco naumanni]|uniref:ankyrin repeat domain-containing protein 26-like n=1 Tax=Falco naumanni TaxID=148594 RepID=UPI001ADE64DA|nr:ankyrin repeat domain-containing protein 26-like [Falco naumanni]
MKAVQCQQEECVAILLEHGANPHLADADGNTALHLAVRSPNTTVAGLLLEHNANIDARNKEGNTLLILAISEHHEDIAEFLLQKGADVHARDHCERTPLMTAASGGQLNLIKVLLQYGADLFHKGTNGWTAEDYAVTHGYSSLCKQLVAYAFRGGRDEGGAQGDTVPGIPHRARAAGLTLGAPAVDRGAIDDLSQGDSIRSLEKEGSDVSWHTSEEELDFTPKKLQKPNLTLLMNVSQQFRKNTGKNPRLESQRPNSVFLEHVDDEDTEEEQCEVDNKVCEALKQESENLCLNRHEENVRAAFHSGTKEKSPEQEEEEKEQEKEDTGEDLQTASVEGVKNSICNDSHQVHSASKDNTGERSALTAVGAEEEEDAESPWDSETDSESPEEGSPGVLLPAADRHGARSRIVSGEHHTGFLEKPNNSQLKTSESVLERNETSPNKKQQKSDLLEEFGLGDAEGVEGIHNNLFVVFFYGQTLCTCNFLSNIKLMALARHPGSRWCTEIYLCVCVCSLL